MVLASLRFFDLVSLGLGGCFLMIAFEDSEKQKQECIRFAHRAIFARFARSRCKYHVVALLG